jgi:formylglycine-generating enzyme
MVKDKRFLIFLFAGFFVISCAKGENSNQVVRESEPQTENNVEDKGLIHFSEGKLSPEMVLVEGGSFTMGKDSVKTNQPHIVELSSFYMAKYMVTNGEWKQFLEDVELEFSWDWDDGVGYGPFSNIVPTDDCPAQGLNWYYAVIFCNWASLKDGLEPSYVIDKLPESWNGEIDVEWIKSANGYRLPTEAEWEYAARGGQLSKGFKYPGSNDWSEVGKARKEISSSYPVGQFKPNELGIYDMGGNASEWCWDWYDEVMFEWLSTENPSVDYRDDVKVKSRYGDDKKIIRGSSWYLGERAVFRRSAYPPKNIGMTGIRLVRNAE